MKAEILIGVSGSGKTTYAMIQTDYTIVCRDDIRFGSVMPNARGWKDYVFSDENEQKVTAIHTSQIDRCAELGQNLIVADTNLSKKNRRKLIQYLQEIGYEVELVIINLPLAACIERDAERGVRSVGEKIILQQWETLDKNMDNILEEKKIFNIRVKMFDNYGAYEHGYI
ncbi:MAG: AAA family ATPase [Flavobacterium sp.]